MTTATETSIRALLFDKDGTLFDFQRTWGPFGLRVVEQLSGGEPSLSRRLASAIGIDLSTGVYSAQSLVIAGTTTDVVKALSAHLPEWSGSDLTQWLDREAKSAGERSLAPAAKDLAGLLETLQESGYVLGVATNDSRASALSQLSQAGITERFDFVAGYDSVEIGKPAPDMIHAFAAAIDTPTSAIAMIGDSLHDLAAARAAGCGAAIGVLTGPASEAALTPHADAVLPSIDDLPAWLAARNPTAA